jgi:predicted Fe-Mo cluster-binding NifX family protein
MACWKWFMGILKEAGITITEENRAKVDKIIHEFIGEKAKYEHCSPDWSKMGKKIRADESKKKKLIAKLKASLQ